MIEAVVDLFIERTAPVAPVALAAATRMLVVDATGQPEELQEILVALEREGPIEVSLVALEELERVPRVAAFDRAWLVLSRDFEPAYAGLICEQLSREHPAALVEQLRCGDDLPVAAFGGALPWRRRAAAARAAKLLGERFR